MSDGQDSTLSLIIALVAVIQGLVIMAGMDYRDRPDNEGSKEQREKLECVSTSKVIGLKGLEGN